ncbi:unnamed protein product [Adineta steineri]|uniref:U-box domain-containing protein n=1 Tax=Adineta steineri TaxID=433720 RepID=A0A819TVC3_9BILA|nr:unnamed protein product [Adineta steineri]
MQAAPQNRPEEYDLVCPITLRVFRDPVTAADGHTYERQAIVRWIKEHGTSPLTRQPLNIDDLMPDYDVKDIIDRRPSLTASIDVHDESMANRNQRITPVNNKVLITKLNTCHVLHEGLCCRRRCCILIMILSAIVLLSCALTAGLFMTITSSMQPTYSSSLNASNPKYCRLSKKCSVPDFYFEAIPINVSTNGSYSIVIKSRIDTYAYIYKENFNLSKPKQNLLRNDGDSSEEHKSHLKVFLRSGHKYILVVTTKKPRETGMFTVTGSGVGSVIFV